ncbi:uncharacterized protein LOC144174730 [Haemaphysalis longicornis]
MSHYQDYYSVLGISRNATMAEVNRAYKALALQWHPDKNATNKEKAERMFRLIAEAHNILGNEASRQRYDTNLRKNSLPKSPSGTLRAYCYIVPSFPRTGGTQQSCSYTQNPVATYPHYSMTSMYRPTASSSHHPMYGYNLYQPSSSQYVYNIPLSSYVPKQAMSMTGYPSPYQQLAAASRPALDPDLSLVNVPTEYERQTSTRIIQGTRMDLEVIKENAAEIVNVYENGVLTQSTFRRTGPTPHAP